MRNRKPPDEKTPQGTPSQTEQGEAAPKYVTEEQLNRAITSRLDGFGKKIEKTLSESFATTLGTKLDEFKASLGTPASGGGDGTPPKGGDVDSPLVKGLQKQLDEQKASVLQMKAERDAEKARSRDQALRSKLSEDLTKGGLDPRYVKAAVGNLVDVEKRVRFAADEGDEIVFKDSSGEVDLATGLKDWVKSDDAKIYLPPRGTQGAGDRSGGRTPQQGKAVPSVGATLLGMAQVLPETPQG